MESLRCTGSSGKQRRRGAEIFDHGCCWRVFLALSVWALGFRRLRLGLRVWQVSATVAPEVVAVDILQTLLAVSAILNCGYGHDILQSRPAWKLLGK